MQIKRQTDQAIRMLVYMASRRQVMLGKELAGLVGVSEKYLPYIMKQLRQAELVSSSSGITGGYVLARSAKEITLLDVMAATSDKPQISCYLKGDEKISRYGKSDALLDIYDLMHEIAQKYFGSITIWDLTDPERMKAVYANMDNVKRHHSEYTVAP